MGVLASKNPLRRKKLDGIALGCMKTTVFGWAASPESTPTTLAVPNDAHSFARFSQFTHTKPGRAFSKKGEQMATLSPRTVSFMYSVAPTIRIQTTALGDPTSYGASETTPNIAKIWKEVMDKVLEQCTNSTPSHGVPMDDLEIGDGGTTLSWDPSYKIKQRLTKVSDGNTVITEIDLDYHITDRSYQVSAWSQAVPGEPYTNPSPYDPRLIKETFARMWTHYKNPTPKGLTLTTYNGYIILTP